MEMCCDSLFFSGQKLKINSAREIPTARFTGQSTQTCTLSFYITRPSGKNVPISYFSLLLFCSLVFFFIFSRQRVADIHLCLLLIPPSLSFTCCTVFSLARPLCGSHCYSHSSLAHSTSLSLSRTHTHTHTHSLLCHNTCILLLRSTRTHTHTGCTVVFVSAERS